MLSGIAGTVVDGTPNRKATYGRAVLLMQGTDRDRPHEL